jgi:lipoprotein-anchoring transpeptidase ErfK/SrfK
MGIEGGAQMTKFRHLRIAGVLGTLVAIAFSGGASADPFTFFNQPNVAQPSPPAQTSAYADSADEEAEVAAEFRRQTVDYRSSEAPGTIIIGTPNTYLYLVLGGGEALRYGIGVGREGFTWSGTKTIERKAEWPDWTPPPEMIERQPYLPRFVAGGPGNPLGARAMYLSGSVYRTAPTPRPLSAVRSLPAASAWSMRT